MTTPPAGPIFIPEHLGGELAAVAAKLRGSHPWIPGADFVAVPGLAEYLAQCVEAFAAATGPDAE